MSLQQEKKRLTIGIMSNSLDYEYQIMVWAGVQAAAEEMDANMICFCGAEINSPDKFRNTRNKVNALINSRNIDGLIIVPSTTCSYMSLQEIEEFLAQYGDMPIVSIGMSLKKIPSLIVDNKYGFKTLVDHLIEVHNRKNFLYIGGPEKNTESIERFDAFKQSLDEHGLSIAPDHMGTGNFFMQQTYDLILKILDKKMEFDAVVAANDNMAIGAVRALQERNIIIPDDVTVTGFDDIYMTRTLTSPLTTVRQPIYEMAKKAAAILFDRIKGRKVDEVETLKTIPIIRRSCGCLNYEIGGLAAAGVMSGMKKDPDYTEIKVNILSELKDINGLDPADVNYEIYEHVMDHFFLLLKKESSESGFFGELNKALNKAVMAKFDNVLWNSLFFSIRKRILPYYFESPVALTKLEDTLHQVQVVINETSKQMEKNSGSRQAEKIRSLQRVLRDMVNSFNISVLADKMVLELPKIGISSCYLSLFASEDLKNAKLIAAYNSEGRIPVEPDGYLFPSLDIFPRDLVKDEKRFNLIVESLSYENDMLGFIAVDFNPLTIGEVLISVVNDLIKTALKAALLLQEAVEKGRKIENTLLDLKNQHIKLEEAYGMLKENKEKLVISEKMASLGKLTAGIAHEMNTPLATARTAMNEMHNLVNEYRISLTSPEITREDHEGISEDMKTNIMLAEKAIEKAVSFIKSIKSQTMEINSKEKNNFNAVEIINDSILLISHLLKIKSLSVDFKFSSNRIMLYGLPGRFAQIITNLMTNSIDALSEKKGETVNVTLSENEKSVILIVEDKGTGISDSIITKIYDPLFTTKPFGQGAGLGLTLVHEIVYGDFNGMIDVDTQKGIGTKFTVILNK